MQNLLIFYGFVVSKMMKWSFLWASWINIQSNLPWDVCCRLSVGQLHTFKWRLVFFFLSLLFYGRAHREHLLFLLLCTCTECNRFTFLMVTEVAEIRRAGYCNHLSDPSWRPAGDDVPHALAPCQVNIITSTWHRSYCKRHTCKHQHHDDKMKSCPTLKPNWISN